MRTYDSYAKKSEWRDPEEVRAEIEKQIEEFLQKGGKIEVVPTNKFGVDYSAPGAYNNRKKREDKRGKD